MELITNSTEDICLICHENYENKKEYTLECNHKYHTDCIMKWFRLGNEKCPLCNDKGNNNNIGWFDRITKLSQCKQLARRKDCPTIVKTNINKLKKIENDFKIYKKNFQEFKNNNKELINKYKQQYRKRWYYRRKIREIEHKICNITNIFPIYIIKKK